MQIIELILRLMVVSAIPLLIVAIGGMFSERSGVVNIALEGIMLVGAFSGIVFINKMQSAMMIRTILGNQLLLLGGLVVGGLVGMVISLAHAFASIKMKANQVISGTAINIFAASFVVFMARQVFGYQQVYFMDRFKLSIPVLKDIPILGAMLFNNAYLSTYLGMAILIIGAHVLYKTRFGLRLRACGEHPQAADAAGINVYKIRYASVLISGFLAGLGGVALIVPTSVNFNATVYGFGFLALAVLIFGQWKPYRILIGSLIFGLALTVASASDSIPFLQALNLNRYFYNMIPYIITLIVLGFTSKKSQGPRAAGQPYDKGKR